VFNQVVTGKLAIQGYGRATFLAAVRVPSASGRPPADRSVKPVGERMVSVGRCKVRAADAAKVVK
jgi:hypothetical protein